MKIKIFVMTKNGNQFEVELPAKRIVCPQCEGTGKTLCDGLRGEAFTSEDFDADPDFAHGYMNGHYDVQCGCCKGANVISIIDRKALTPKMLDRVQRQEREDYNDRQIEISERFMGA